jgi:hypothetical protein
MEADGERLRVVRAVTFTGDDTTTADIRPRAAEPHPTAAVERFAGAPSPDTYGACDLLMITLPSLSKPWIYNMGTDLMDQLTGSGHLRYAQIQRKPIHHHRCYLKAPLRAEDTLTGNLIDAAIREGHVCIGVRATMQSVIVLLARAYIFVASCSRSNPLPPPV